jgi:hypothetical protein
MKKINKKTIRKTIKEGDELFYADKEYLFFRKDGEFSGTMLAHFDLIDIGLTAEETEQVLMFYKKDYETIMKKFISRVEKLIKEYPEDIEIRKLNKKE